MSDLYDTPQSIGRLISLAGLKKSYINLQGASINIWFSIFEEAQKRKLVYSIIQEALADYSNHEGLKQLRNEWLPLDQYEDSNSLERDHSPEEDVLSAAEQQDVITRYEVLLSKDSSGLLPINFLETGQVKASSVVMIRREGNGKGTGFLLEDNYLLTNHHVIPDAETARNAKILFNYQDNPDGWPLQVEAFALDPDVFFEKSKENDWALIKIKGNPKAKYGFISLGEEAVADIHENDRVMIIQHPDGDPSA